MPMRVLVLSINYAPEPTGFAPHVTALCEHLVREHHEVTAISGFPFAPYWSRWDHEGKGTIARETRNRVSLYRVRHFVPRQPRRLAERILMEGTFSLLALWTVLTRVRMRPDVILYVGAQPSIAMVARLLGVWHRCPYVIAVNDLAAQAATDVGIVRKGSLFAGLRLFERAAYRRASGAIVLCRAFRDALVADGFPADRISIVPSPVDVDVVRPTNDTRTFRRTHDIDPDAFVVLYSGSMGVKQDLATVVEAARILGPDQGVVWVLVGEGELKSEVARRIEREQLERCVRLLPFEPETGMAAMFSSADVLLLSQLATVKDTVIPSKLLTYMASGRPVVASVHPESEAASLMKEVGGGTLVAPERPDDLVRAILDLKTNRRSLAELGVRNRRYAELTFDVRSVVARQEQVLREAVMRAAPAHR